MYNIIRAKEYMFRLRLIRCSENWCMFSSFTFKGTLSQIMHAAYPIVCFPVLVRAFLRKGFVSMHTVPGIVFVYITGILKIVCKQFWQKASMPKVRKF